MLTEARESGIVEIRIHPLESRTITISEMLNAYSPWPGLAKVYRLERQFQWRRNGHTYHASCEVEFGIASLTRQEAYLRES